MTIALQIPYDPMKTLDKPLTSLLGSKSETLGEASREVLGLLGGSVVSVSETGVSPRHSAEILFDDRAPAWGRCPLSRLNEKPRHSRTARERPEGRGSFEDQHSRRQPAAVA